MLDKLLNEYGKSQHLRNLIRRVWSAAAENEHARLTRPMPPMEGCGDNSCAVAPPQGIGTNGGCRCGERKLRAAVHTLKAEIDRLNAGKVAEDAP